MTQFNTDKRLSYRDRNKMANVAVQRNWAGRKMRLGKIVVIPELSRENGW